MHQRVFNKKNSDEEDFLSGVPQGTILASVLLLMMVSDMEKEIGVVRYFFFFLQMTPE